MGSDDFFSLSLHTFTCKGKHKQNQKCNVSERQHEIRRSDLHWDPHHENITKDDVDETLCPKRMFVHEDGQIYKVQLITANKISMWELKNKYMIFSSTRHPLSADQVRIIYVLIRQVPV